MENEVDGSEVLETTEETVEETVEETPEVLKARIAELEGKVSTTEAEKAELGEKNKQLFARLKKNPESKQENLSNKDLLYLAKADIHEDDMDEVLEIAKLRKVPVSEAHKFMKPILAQRQEERTTAAATQTKGGARGTSKVSGEDLLARAERTGEVPDTAEGMSALFSARLARRLGKK